MRFAGTGTRDIHAIPFVPPHIRLGKKKISVLDRWLTNGQAKGRNERGEYECRTVRRAKLDHFAVLFSSSVLHLLFFLLTTFLSLPSPYLLFLRSSRFRLQISLVSSFTALLGLFFRLHSSPPVTGARDLNRSKVGMARLRTVTNMISKRLFPSTTVERYRSSLRLDSNFARVHPVHSSPTNNAQPRSSGVEIRTKFTPAIERHAIFRSARPLRAGIKLRVTGPGDRGTQNCA